MANKLQIIEITDIYPLDAYYGSDAQEALYCINKDTVIKPSHVEEGYTFLRNVTRLGEIPEDCTGRYTVFYAVKYKVLLGVR